MERRRHHEQEVQEVKKDWEYFAMWLGLCEELFTTEACQAFTTIAFHLMELEPIRMELVPTLIECVAFRTEMLPIR